MPPSKSLRPRRPVEWLARIALAVGTAAAGYSSISHTLANILPRSEIARAHWLAPDNGQITGILAQTMLRTTDAKFGTQRPSERLAKKALIQDPTTVSAIVTLALNAQLRGDTSLARNLFRYSQSLSRRNLETQIWAAEDAVSENDIKGAIKHYDIALRTSDVAPDFMFPVLAQAISEPAIRSALISTLSTKPIWGEAFIDYVSGKGPTPLATVQLLKGLQRAGLAPTDNAKASIINALFTGGEFEEAWSYYASMHPRINRQTSRDPYFNANVPAPSQFDWIASTSDGINASIQRGEKNGIFDFVTAPSVGGVVLQQIQMLPIGEYRLEGHSLAIDQPKISQPYWTITCYQGVLLAQFDVPNSTVNLGIFSGRVSVPQGCPVQILTLVARPSDMISGASGQIDRIQLGPVH